MVFLIQQRNPKIICWKMLQGFSWKRNGLLTCQNYISWKFSESVESFEYEGCREPFQNLDEISDQNFVYIEKSYY